MTITVRSSGYLRPRSRTLEESLEQQATVERQLPEPMRATVRDLSEQHRLTMEMLERTWQEIDFLRNDPSRSSGAARVG